MIYILSAFIIGAGVHTLTFGVSLWKEDKNKLGGFGAVTLAIIGTVVPIIMLFVKR